VNDVVQFLAQCGTFFVATADGDQPRVRPFGAVLEHGERIYFCTGNQKEFYKQCVKNPKTEICACNENGQWLRITGSIVFEKNTDVKRKFFDAMPGLGHIYQSADSPVFEVFCLQGARATFYSFAAPPRTVVL
jgi:uncharacterized pyridoxamine 5'-phosphate oxidase family protein